MFSQIYLLCGSHNKVKRLRLKFVSLLKANVGQRDFMEHVSQFYLFVEDSVILTHIYFTFFTIKKITGVFKNEHQFPPSYYFRLGKFYR